VAVDLGEVAVPGQQTAALLDIFPGPTAPSPPPSSPAARRHCRHLGHPSRLSVGNKALRFLHIFDGVKLFAEAFCRVQIRFGGSAAGEALNRISLKTATSAVIFQRRP